MVASLFGLQNELFMFYFDFSALVKPVFQPEHYILCLPQII